MSNNTGLNDAGDIFDRANARTLAPTAVGLQVAIMSVISIITILVFNFLRPKNKIIYEPKVKYHVGDKIPPKISESQFGWLPPIFRTQEAELLDKVGLDAVTYLRFLRLLRWLFTCIALLTCAILIPINVWYNLRFVPSSNRDVLSMLTIRDVSGSWLFIHVAASYAITLLVCLFVYYHWKAVLQLRYDWFRSPEYIQSFYARTLLIRRVPKKYHTDEGLQSVFEGLQIPYPATSVHIGRKVGKLPELIEYHNAIVREFEQVLIRYLRGGRPASKRPTIRIGGFLGLFGGVKMDAIDFYTAKLKRTEDAIETYRGQIDQRKAERYGFASMAAVPYAHVVARLLRGKRPKGCKIELAPNPKDIIWQNMNRSETEMLRRRIIGWVLIGLVCFFNTLPLAIISVLANLGALRAYVPFLETWYEDSSWSFAIVSGVLPPAVMGLFTWGLPIIIGYLSRYQGALTNSRLERAVVARYFSVLVISQLVVFTLLGVIFNSVKEIILQIGRGKDFAQIVQNFDKLPGTINRTYIDQASYWLTFFPMRGFLVVFDLAQILNLVWTFFRTRIFGRTPRDIREWTQPPDFEYAIYYSNIIFMAAVAFVFAPLAPLVALAGAIVFWLSSWVYKYQLMYVFVTKIESGGRLWNMVINRLLVGVILMQLLMVLTIGLQYGFRSLVWLCTIPPIIIILVFKIYLMRRFNPVFRYYIPSDEELRMAKVHSERADNTGHRLERRFGHPALNADLFTPMLHAKMMPLLGEVYRGKIGSSTQAKLNEYGGQKLDARIVGEEGIKIAAVDQRDLEYDPVLYQRDRGELDWDQRSIASTAVLSDAASARYSSNPGYFDASGGSSTPVQGYERYLSMGPINPNMTTPGTQASDVELTPLEVTQDQTRPLLHHGPPSGYFDPSQQPQRPPSRPYAAYPPQYAQPQPQNPNAAQFRFSSAMTAPSAHTASPPASVQNLPMQQYPPQQLAYNQRPYSPAPSGYDVRPGSQQSQGYPQGHGRQASGFSAYDGRPESQQGVRPPLQQGQGYPQGHGRQASGLSAYDVRPDSQQGVRQQGQGLPHQPSWSGRPGGN